MEVSIARCVGVLDRVLGAERVPGGLHSFMQETEFHVYGGGDTEFDDQFGGDFTAYVRFFSTNRCTLRFNRTARRYVSYSDCSGILAALQLKGGEWVASHGGPTFNTPSRRGDIQYKYAGPFNNCRILLSMIGSDPDHLCLRSIWYKRNDDNGDGLRTVVDMEFRPDR
jgi:hypothetical protein